MGVLTERFVENLIHSTNAQKEEFGNKIVEKLGGNPEKIANHLPPRRGNGDGGIDGRIPIFRDIIIDKRRSNGAHLNSSKVIREQVEAAFCIKIERSQFDREQLGAFKNDMEREEIYEGIIISARKLSPDAEAEIKRINDTGSYHIVHILLSDFIQGNFNADFEFINDPKEVFKQSLKEYLGE